MGTIRRGISWPGPVGPELITALAGFRNGNDFSMHAVTHPIEWALDVLGFNATHATAGSNGHGRNGNGSRDGRGRGRIDAGRERGPGSGFAISEVGLRH